MIFTQVPPYYSSVFEPLLYRMTNIKEGVNSDVEIYTTLQQDALGVKRIAPGSAAEVNISSYMRRYISPVPFPVDSAGLFQDEGRYVVAGITCQGVMSPIRTYVGAARRVYEFEMLSSLPTLRTIAWDESDEVSFVVPNSSLTYSIELSGTKNYTFESGEYIASRGVVSITVGMPGIAGLVKNAGMVPDDFSKMRIRVRNVGRSIGEVEYYIRSRSAGQVRLCWFNSLGGLDYHTFCKVLSEPVAVSKKVFEGIEGYTPASIRRESYRELSSGYLPRLWVEGLSGLLSSPRVWRVEEGEFIPVDILTAGNALYRDKLNCMELLLRDRIPVTSQNF